MVKAIKKGEENTEADILVEYAEIEGNLSSQQFISLVRGLITGKQDLDSNRENWKVIQFIAEKTGAVDIDYDVDVETGDWGLPVYSGGPIGYSVSNKEYLIKLLEYLEDKFNDTFIKINRYFIRKEKEKWVCRSCARFLGKELKTYSEVKKQLNDFSIKKYWKCRSCKKENWFEINEDGTMSFFCS